MTEVLHGNAGGNQLNASADKTQAYGLSGNDTLISSGKSDVLLVGGSGDDSLIMTGGKGTLSGGDGADTFELNYSADKPLAAVIEDLEPARDKIVVNFDGKTAPELSSVVSGDDVIWTDGDGLFTLTLKGVRENDYFDGTISDEAWEVLKLTNDEREKNNLSPLTMAQGLTAGAAIRAGEITSLGESGLLVDHTRPKNRGGFSTVFKDVDKTYLTFGENLDGGAESAAAVMEDWIGSPTHHKNILDPDFQKLGVGYNYLKEDASGSNHYWVQLFADSLIAAEVETVSTAELLSAIPTVNTVATKFITLTKGKDTYSNDTYGATIAARGGNDSISNAGLTVSISGGAGSDTVNNSGAYATINGGAGSDSIVNSGANLLIEYASGDGSDTITGFNKTSTLKISGDEYTPATVGNDVIISVGADSIQLVDAATLTALNIDGTRSKLYTGTDDKDNFNNTVDGATINALGGNDNVTNSGASVIINGGKGKDKIFNEGTSATISGGEDNDTIKNDVDNVTISGNGGNDLINNDGASVSIDGGEGVDKIISDGAGSTIGGGIGNDSIINYGASVIVDGAGGNDYIDNRRYSFFNEATRKFEIVSPDNVTISGGDGSDTIENKGAAVSINGGDGADIFDNKGTAVSISGEAGADKIKNNGDNVTIDGGDDNDTIDNGGDSVAISGGAGNDSIKNKGAAVSISGEDGNDAIENKSANVTITGGDGSDTINNTNSAKKVSIVGGAGNDSITNSANNVTIAGGLGDDTISLVQRRAKNNVINYTAGDGNDVITGFNETSTLSIAGGEYIRSTVKNDVILAVGADSITLKNAAKLSAIHIDGTEQELNPEENITKLTEGDDNYTNTVDGATIAALGGDDYILNKSADRVSIAGGAGKDEIWNGRLYDNTEGGDNATIDGGAGNDSISNYGINCTLTGNAGDDTIYNRGYNVIIEAGLGDDSINSDVDPYYGSSNYRHVTIYGDAGNDTVRVNDHETSVNGGDGNDFISIAGGVNDWTNNTLQGGAGDDTIYGGRTNVAMYKEGDGNDSVWGVKENSTLNLLMRNESALSSQVSGDDVIFTVGDGKITLKGSKNSLPEIIKTTVPSDVFEYNDHYYYLFDESVTWEQAGAYCKTRGGYLVTITDEGEQNFVQDLVDKKGTKNNYWLGGFRGSDGSWQWITDDENFDYTNWASESPNNASGDRNALMMYNSTISGYELGDWNDIKSDGTFNDNAFFGKSNFGFICEWGAYITKDSSKIIMLTENADTYRNRLAEATIFAYGSDDTIENEAVRAAVYLGEGNDSITNERGSSNVTIFGGAGADSIYNSGASASILGEDGDDYIENVRNNRGGGLNVTINGGAGKDTIRNLSGNATLNGGDGDDSISSKGVNASIAGGTGDDKITLSSDSRKDFLQYTNGDGNDTVWGISKNSTLNILGIETYSSVVSGNDLTIKIGDGSILFVDGKNKAPHIIIGESGSSGGGSGGNGNGGGGSGNGGGGGGSTGGGSNSGNTSGASGGNSASGTGGGTSGGGTGGGSRSDLNRISTTTDAPIAANVYRPPIQHNYYGGNQVISDYRTGDNINFNAEYTGADYDGAGNFVVNSPAGVLVVQNTTGKVIDINDSAGNALVKAYEASRSEVIDGRGLSGFEIINGSSNPDTIYAGDGGSQLWGGADNVTDLITGGGGEDIFIGGKNQGSENFRNVSTKDTVYLSDVTLSDITEVKDTNGFILLTFNTGNTINIQSSELLSAAITFADGTAHRFNHMTRTWQA